jgi:glycosyltransferase involved in cell wall biosynthesis
VSPGRLERYKGHHRVIDALPALLRDRPDAHLRILGGGPDEADLRLHAARLGLQDRIEIRAEPDRQAMAATFARAEAVVSLSEYESHGLAVLEALSLGRPTVVTAGSALAELVEAGLARGVPEDASSAAIADAIREAMATPTTGSRPELPSWDACAAETAALYRRVVRPIPGGRR